MNDRILDAPDMAARVLGEKYRMVSLLGEGGMGAVWRAEDLALGRSVAVKFIREERLTEETRTRFLREARIAASIQHRNIIRILDYGTDADGCPYLVMELLEGQSLQDLFGTQAPTPTASLLAIMGGVLAGLEAVHGAGIVHRDLKPENVFLAQETDAVIPKLLDFGISRPVEVDLAAPPAGITNTGALVGTPYYMSPEQVQGDRSIDARSDLWSVGVILYEGLTGVQPFTGASLGALVVQIATGDCPPLSAKRPDLSAELVSVVSRAMARRREDRFESARELRRALLAAAASGETTGQLAATTSGVHVPGARRPLPLLAGLALALVLCVGAAVLWTSASPPREPAPARPPPETAAHVTTRPARASEIPTVTVRLRDLPATAEIRVDGQRQAGPVLSLARDDRRHVIEVTAPGVTPWRVEHDGRADGDYQVQLAAAPAPRPEKREKGARPARGKNGLPILGDPGF